MNRIKMNPTRYLCAAVQLDEFLCEQIIDEFIEDDYTAIGISHGIDLPTVIKSCLLADARREKRDIILFVLFIAASISVLINHVLFWIIFLAAWIVMFLYKKVSRYEIVGGNFLKENFNSKLLDSFPISLKVKTKLEEISKTQDANVIIYGGKSPFVGSGLPIGGWSLSVDASKEKEGNSSGNPSTFQIAELFEYVSKSVSELNLNNLKIEDYLYINGRELREKQEFLPNPFMRPITKLDDIDFQNYIKNTAHSTRHYKCVQITDWDGELITSVFFRFSMIGQNLFIEVNYYLLTPLQPHYHEFDRMKSKASRMDIFKLIIETLLTMILWSIVSPLSIFGRLIRWFRFVNFRKNKRQRKEIMSNMAYNYGSVTSLREKISRNNEYTCYFQHLDQEMYFKAIERRIIDSLLKFLDGKNIDISDFKDVKSTIINHGVMLSDKASIKAINFSGGSKSTLISNNDSK